MFIIEFNLFQVLTLMLLWSLLKDKKRRNVCRTTLGSPSRVINVSLCLLKFGMLKNYSYLYLMNSHHKLKINLCFIDFKYKGSTC